MKLKLKTGKLVIFLFIYCLSANCFSQAYLVLGATPTYVNISGGTIGTPIYLIVGNISRTAGHIVSEGQYNYVNWKNTGIASYTIPFGYSTTDYIPFTFNKTAGAAADLLVSTWGTPNTNLPWANTTNVAAVANMNCPNCSPANSDGSIGTVIDRWWSINTTATANLTFSYRGAENTTTVSPTGTFAAQHWNGTAWDAPVGSGTGVTTGIGTVTVTGASTFSPWILSTQIAPLPVEFLTLSAECEHGDVTVKWITASEQNSDYFTVEKSFDGTIFFPIATITAAHNSSTVQNYSSADNDTYSGTSFYRIKETDFSGAYIYSGIIAINGCSADEIIIYGEDGGAAVNISASENAQYIIEMFNMLGQKIVTQLANVTAGNNHIKLSSNTVASAIYVVKVYNNNNSAIKKVFILSNNK